MAKKIELEFELKYKEAAKNLDEFQKEYAKLEKEVQSANKKTENALKKVEKSAKDGAKGVKKVGASIKTLAKATGIIFLLQKAFEFVSSAIQENQEVMDGLNTIFQTAQIVFNEIVGVFVDVYKSVSSATENFDALGKVLGGIITVVLSPFKLAFYGISLAVQEAQLMWEKSFFGDGDPETIKELNLAILETKSNIVDVATETAKAAGEIVDNFGEAITEVTEIGTQVVDGLKEVSIEAAIETAKTNQALKKSAQIAAAESRILLEQYDRQAEVQRQIRDDETLSIEERKKANDELLVILEKQETEMTKNAKLVKDAAQAQFDLTGKTEDYVAVLEAEAEVQAVAATVTGFKSEQQVNNNALVKEATELTNAKLESESLLSIEQKRFNAEQVEDELARLEALKEVDTLEAEQESLRLQAIVDNANAGTQAKIDAQIALNQFTEQSRQTNLNRDKQISDARIKISDAEEKAKKDNLDKTASVLENFSNIAGKETAAGKAFAVAAATINTYRGVSDALAATTVTPFETALKFANAAAIGISGIANVKKILSVKTPPVSGGSASPSGSPTPAPLSVPPAFNIVGASGTNQLASAIGEQSQQPVQAFVVSSEVTTAQELDRNIIDEATID
tara:strand:+ start:63 stop:1940 length:1878 start_codon:yes stop_codon:yes gene_type:complete